MLEKLGTETLSLTRSLDESWDVFDDERSAFMLHDTEIRDERRERIIRDFWFYIRDRLDDGRFPSIRESDESDISDEL